MKIQIGSIRFKIIVLSLGICIAAITTIAILGYKMDVDSETKHAKILLSTITKETNQFMQTVWALRVEQTDSFASKSNVKNLVTLYNQKEDGSLHDISQLDIAKNGVQLDFNNFVQETGQIVNYSTVVVLDKHGKVIFSNRENLIQADFSKTKWFIDGQKKNLYFINKNFQKLGITTVSPIDVNSGETIGVVTITRYANIIVDNLKDRTYLGDTGETYLVNINRTMVTESRFIPDAEYNLKVDTFPVKNCFEKGIDISGERYLDYRGKEVFGSSRCMSEIGLVLIAEQDVHERLQNLDDFANKLFWTSFSLIPLAFFISYIISNKIVHSLRRLKDSIRKFESGEKFETISITESNDETNQLTKSFNDMSLKIQNRTNDLLVKQKELEENKKLTDDAYTHLAESEGRYKNLFELSPDPIRVSTLDGITISVNKKFEEKFGYSNEELIGKSLFEIIDERSKNISRKYLDELVHDIRYENKEIWYKKKDGTCFPALVSMSINLNQKGEPVELIAIIKDVSEIYKSREKIERGNILIQVQKRREQYTRSLIEASLDPLVTINPEGKITDVNEATVKAIGVEREVLIGTDFSDYFTEPHKAREGYEHTFQEGFVRDYPLAIRHVDGHITQVMYNAVTYRDELGNIAGVFAAARDITGIKELTKKLEEVQTVEKLKDEFAAMVSHELRNPLFPIRFRAEILKDPDYGKLNNAQLNAVEDIIQNSIILERLIDDVLDVQKLEMNKMKFTVEYFEIDKFMNDIKDLHIPLVKEKEIILVNSTKENFVIKSDKARLTQVFSNLIKNSVDFVSEKTGKIEIGAHGDDNQVIFYVKDNGIGIPKNKQDKLFQKFYQIDTTFTRKHRGSGLGLSICKGIVEGLRGKIWIESEEGKGTNVYFSFVRNSASNSHA